MNHDVSTRAALIMINERNNSFVEPTMDCKDPRETWQVIDALNTYTLALSAVWPEDWTGQALQCIMTNYRWLANCGKSKSTQVNLVLSFINHVLGTNALRGRSSRPPLTYKQIEDALAERVWTKGVDKHQCSAGRDPYASYASADTMKPHTMTSVQNANASQSTGRTPKTPNLKKTDRYNKPPKEKKELCRSYNSPTGCHYTNCKYQHGCNRMTTSRTYCRKTDHNADTHT